MPAFIRGGNGEGSAIPIRFFPGIGFTGQVAVALQLILPVKRIGGIGYEHVVHACVGVGIDLIGDESCEDGGGHGDGIPIIPGLVRGCAEGRAIILYYGGGLQGKPGELYLPDGLRDSGCLLQEAGDGKNEELQIHGAELLTNAIFLPSGDQDGVLIEPCPP